MRRKPILFASDEELRERVAAETPGRSNVAVAVFQEGDWLYGHVPNDGGTGFSYETPVVVGCVAKCLTAALVADAVCGSRIGMQDRIADLLRLRSSRGHDILQGITIEHMLNHTHGLDDSAMDPDAMPRSANGRVDVDLLCSEIASAPRIAPPGQMYSYGGIGSWLVAGLLEQIHAVAYPEILQRRLFEPMGIQSATYASLPDICPAWGGPFSMSAVDLLRFLRPQLSDETDSAPGYPSVMRSGRIDMPGWGPWQKRATSGWNEYGDRWLGHNGNRDGTGIALRFNRNEGVAIAVTASREVDCFYILARLFGDVLDEFSSDYVGFPRTIEPDAWAAADKTRLLGDYQNSRWRVRVGESPRKGFLRMSVFDRRSPSSGSVLNRYLRAAEGDVYHTVPAGADYPFVQFIGETQSQHKAYLWNGRQLWKFAE